MEDSNFPSSWMRLPLPRSAISLVVVIAAYWTYGLLVVPAVEPQIQTSQAATGNTVPAEATPIVGLNPIWHGLFAKDSWEVQKPKILETRQFTLLFQEYTTESKDLPGKSKSNSLNLRPCTVICHPNGIPKTSEPGKSRVFVLTAPDGASLEFEGKVDIHRGQPGKLIGGLLAGPIHIDGPESEPGADDKLHIETQNVSLTSDRISTPHPVVFQYGRCYGQGRALNIQLQVDRQAKISGQPLSSVGGLRSIELMHVDRVHLELADSSETSQAATDQHPSHATHPIPVDITCRGRFLFDFLGRSARFEQQVDVVGLQTDGISDQLNCEVLELQFTNIHPVDLDDGSPPDKEQKRALSKLRPQKLIASGHPAIARSPTSNAEVRAEQMVYDLEQRQIRLSDSKMVFVKYGPHIVETPKIVYTLAAAKSNVAVGRGWAAGPGKLSTPTGNHDAPPISVTWRQKMELRPQDGFHVLSMLGGATVALDSMGKIRSRDIHCWFSAQSGAPKDDGLELVGPSNRAETTSLATKVENSLNLNRLMALRDVHIESTQLQGRTEHLEAWFIEDPRRDGPSTLSQPTPSEKAKSDIPAERAMLTADHRPANRKLQVVGDKISLSVSRNVVQSNVQGVSVEGNVHVAEVSTVPQAAGQQFSLKGNALQIVHASSPQATLQVSGTPALASFGNINLTANNAHLHRGENRLEIDGAGKMSVPLTEDLEGQPLEHPINLDVTWAGQLEFDGRIIRLTDNIEVHTPTRQIRSDLATVRLSDHIDFQQSTAQHEIDVSRIEFVGNVHAENRTLNDEAQITAVDSIEGRQLTIDKTTENILVTGPGWVKSLRHGQGNLASLTRATAGERVDAGFSLILLKVEFQKTLSGNVKRREFHFEDNVRAMYGPVPNWHAEVNPDRVGGLGQDEILLNCQRLSLYDMGQDEWGNRLAEIHATGNTFVEGNQFTARAQSLVYASAKDILILSGGSYDAELWYRPEGGDIDSHVPAGEIHFSPSTRAVRVIRAGTPTIRSR